MSKIACLAGLLLIAIGVVGYLGQPVEPDVQIDGPVQTEGQPDAADGENSDDSATPKKKKGRSFTALIPALFGAVILLMGVLAFNPNLRKHAMHGAAGVALLGGLAGLGRGIPSLIKVMNDDPDVNRRTMIFLWLMVAVCFGFVFAAANSFIAARKARDAEKSKG